MNLFVLNQDLDVVTIIDTYTSMIWTDRFQECGDFELVKPMDLDILQHVKQDYYLWRNESEHVMIIEKISIKTDAENGSEVTVSGRSLESILDRRIVWGLKILSGNFQDEIQTLLNENVISPSKTERKIDNFIFEKSTDPVITDLRIETQHTGDNLYDIITTACADRGIGFKITLNDQKKFVFKLYAGQDRSYNQTVNPYVVFSPNFDNIIDSSYVETRLTMKNVTLVGGEGEGTERRYTAVGNISGLNRREVFTDARDLSSTIDEDITAEFDFTEYANQVYNSKTNQFVTDNNFNSCKVNVAPYAGRVIEITVPKYNNASAAAPGYATVLVNESKEYISTLKVWEKYDDESTSKGNLETYEIKLPDNATYIYTSMFSQTAIDGSVFTGDSDDFNCSMIKLSNDEYVALMRQRGRETITENREDISFEGQAEASIMFKYGQDFFTGDVVQVGDEYGHEVTARVTEVITSEDAEGYKTYPTFESISNDMNVLPEDYIALDFIRSGGTQYIDTGYKPNNNTRVVMDAESLQDGTFPYFGSRNGTSSSAFVMWQMSETSIRCDYGSVNTTYEIDSTLRRVIIDMDKNGGLFDDIILEADSGTFQATYNMMLLTSQSISGVDSRKMSAKLYSCKIYDGDTLMRNFVPCKDPSDVVGLYDLVDRKFYGNAGTGAFLSN